MLHKLVHHTDDLTDKLLALDDEHALDIVDATGKTIAVVLTWARYDELLHNLHGGDW